jgi:hypothetical protein
MHTNTLKYAQRKSDEDGGNEEMKTNQPLREVLGCNFNLMKLLLHSVALTIMYKHTHADTRIN